jgi:hypothetical protein
MFSRWTADYGDPIDWYRNPVDGTRWNDRLPWQSALQDEASVGDVKLTWEIGRFPQAYHFARAAAFFPELRATYAPALRNQIASFLNAAPTGYGVHWYSGQEIAFRLIAWLFAARTLFDPDDPIVLAIANHLLIAADFVERHIDYARYAVYNNHLLSEALLLYIAGMLVPESPDAGRWRTFGLELLEEGCRRQVYADGGYIQQSHNYHRVALQVLSLAFALGQRDATANETIRGALDRSIDFLYAHQNPRDGRLPNYGANDGALPEILSTCDYSDFRPALQSASVLARGERLFEPGPWDEEAAWLDSRSAAAPLRARRRASRSFPVSGHHVLRGRSEDSFVTFRCGTLRDRFSQIDMLHCDLWWRGINIATDGGSYLYNGPQEWHNHFFRTASHNTITVDGRDQMLHHRRFKTLYWTSANVLEFTDSDGYALVAGEHHGYVRDAGIVHTRSVLFLKDDVFVVHDRVHGAPGEHDIRLHWLLGDFEANQDEAAGRIVLTTPQGGFSLAVIDEQGAPLRISIMRASLEPRRGWLSRYYAEVSPALSVASEGRSRLPYSALSIFSASPYDIVKTGDRFQVSTPAGQIAFAVANGRLSIS